MRKLIRVENGEASIKEAQVPSGPNGTVDITIEQQNFGTLIENFHTLYRRLFQFESQFVKDKLTKASSDAEKIDGLVKLSKKHCYIREALLQVLYNAYREKTPLTAEKQDYKTELLQFEFGLGWDRVAARTARTDNDSNKLPNAFLAYSTTTTAAAPERQERAATPPTPVATQGIQNSVATHDENNKEKIKDAFNRSTIFGERIALLSLVTPAAPANTAHTNLSGFIFDNLTEIQKPETPLDPELKKVMGHFGIPNPLHRSPAENKALAENSYATVAGYATKHPKTRLAAAYYNAAQNNNSFTTSQTPKASPTLKLRQQKSQDHQPYTCALHAFFHTVDHRLNKFFLGRHYLLDKPQDSRKPTGFF